MKKHFRRAFAFMLSVILCISSATLVSAADAEFAISEDAGEQSVGTAVTSREALVKAVRANLIARKENFEVDYNLPEGNYDKSFFDAVYHDAVREYTGNAVEGDYLYWTIGGQNTNFMIRRMQRSLSQHLIGRLLPRRRPSLPKSTKSFRNLH